MVSTTVEILYLPQTSVTAYGELLQSTTVEILYLPQTAYTAYGNWLQSTTVEILYLPQTLVAPSHSVIIYNSRNFISPSNQHTIQRLLHLQQ